MDDVYLTVRFIRLHGH